MTKSEEISHFEQFIASLPRASYLRPWLESIKESVIRDIHNDFLIEKTTTEVRQEQELLIKSAREEAERIMQKAQEQAAKLTRATEQKTADTISLARRRLYEALNTL